MEIGWIGDFLLFWFVFGVLGMGVGMMQDGWSIVVTALDFGFVWDWFLLL